MKRLLYVAISLLLILLILITVVADINNGLGAVLPLQDLKSLIILI